MKTLKFELDQTASALLSDEKKGKSREERLLSVVSKTIDNWVQLELRRGGCPSAPGKVALASALAAKEL